MHTSSGDGTSPTPVIRIRSLSKTFPGTKALTDVDFDVLPGEVHGLIGQNGSGKSTLIKVLAGFHTPDDGASAEMGGVPFPLGDSAVAHRSGLRFVHQDLGLVPTLDAVDNLALGAGYVTGHAGRIRWRRQQRIAAEAVRAIGYHVDVHTPVGLLEPVERTAVAIARSLLTIGGDVTLLVLDEPTATMPQAEVARLHQIVEQIKRRGIGVIYVSHHLDEIFAIADRVTVVRDGRNVGTRTVRGLGRSDLVQLMTGGVEDEPAPTASAPTDDPVLVVEELRGHELLGLDVTVNRGEIVGVAGLNGSGREQLCASIFGGRPRTGSVTVEGSTLAPMAPDQAVELGIGYVPADRHRDGLVLAFNVRENLTLTSLGSFFRRFRLDGAGERKAATSNVTTFGVKTRSSETSVEALSGGNQQKVVLGKWLRVRPRVLLLDEPTQGVDVAAKAEVHRLIDGAAEAGTAVLVCSSDEGELERLCNRVVVMRSGRAVAEFHRPNVVARRLAQESLGLEHSVPHERTDAP